MDATVIDQATATAALTNVRDKLKVLGENMTERTTALRHLIVGTRPAGLLTVDEMAQAIGRDRNYVDSVWSLHGDATKGRQTRVPVAEDASPEAARQAYESLSEAALAHNRAVALFDKARAERDRIVILVYGSKLLGPSAISRLVGIDRNHVLRIARKAGVKPVHRIGSKNQYTADSVSN